MIGTLKVTPEEMREAASTLHRHVITMNDCFGQLKNIMTGMDAYWVGEAADAHKALYVEQVPKTEEFIARCNEHVADLNAMAGVYAEAEQSAMQAAEELPISDL